MDRLTRRFAWSFVVLALLFVPSSTFVIQAFSHPRVSDRAVAWVAGLSQRQLLDASSRFSSLPFAYRKALATRLGPSETGLVWARYLRQFNQQHSDLSSEQTAFIELVAARLADGLLAAPREKRASAIAEVDRESHRLFSREIGRQLFVNMGPSDGASIVHEPPIQRVAAWLVNGLGVVQASFGNCSCSTSSDWCGWFEACAPGMGSCEPSVWVEGDPDGHWQPGCGTLLNYPCDGDCIDTH
jgi:hypothetical protein